MWKEMMLHAPMATTMTKLSTVDQLLRVLTKVLAGRRSNAKLSQSSTEWLTWRQWDAFNIQSTKRRRDRGLRINFISRQIGGAVWRRLTNCPRSRTSHPLHADDSAATPEAAAAAAHSTTQRPHRQLCLRCIELISAVLTLPLPSANHSTLFEHYTAFIRAHFSHSLSSPLHFRFDSDNISPVCCL